MGFRMVGKIRKKYDNYQRIKGHETHLRKFLTLGEPLGLARTSTDFQGSGKNGLKI